jgi:hypothetical protein
VRYGKVVRQKIREEEERKGRRLGEENELAI